MKLRTLGNGTFLAGVLATFLTGCGLNNELADQDEVVTPLRFITANLGDGFPNNITIHSPRIGLVPINSPLYSEKMEQTDFAKSLFDSSGYYEDALPNIYPEIMVTGTYPFRYSADLATLSEKKGVYQYRSPTGAFCRIGVYSIVLFDDVNNDGTFKLEAIDDSLKGITYSLGSSDTIVGWCEEFLLVYIDGASIIPEMNGYIQDHIGSFAQWDQLGDGFNLVMVSQTSKTEAPFSGVEVVSPATVINLQPCSFKQDNEAGAAIFDMESNAARALSLFHFQRNYELLTYAEAYVVPRAGATAVHLASTAENFHMSIDSYEAATPAAQIPIIDVADARRYPSYLHLSIYGSGIFDKGYIDQCHPDRNRALHQNFPHLLINEKVLSNSDKIAKNYGDSNDIDSLINLITVQSDTITIGFPTSGTDAHGGRLRPMYVHEISASVVERGACSVSADSVKLLYSTGTE